MSFLYHYKTVLLYGLPNGVYYLYIYIYIYVLNRVGSIFLERNDFVVKLIPFLPFVSTSTWKLYALVMSYIYGIQENNVSQEIFCYIIWYVKRKNVLQNSFYRVFITEKCNYHVMRPFRRYLSLSLYLEILFI